MLFDDVAIGFFEVLKEADLEPYPTLIAFQDAHWEQYKRLRDEYCSKHKIQLYENMRFIQNAVFMYINYKLATDPLYKRN